MKSAIRNTIRDLRSARSMTQQELADLIFVTRQTVIAIEGDCYLPSLEAPFALPMFSAFRWSGCFSMRRRAGGGNNGHTSCARGICGCSKESNFVLRLRSGLGYACAPASGRAGASSTRLFMAGLKTWPFRRFRGFPERFSGWF